MTQTQLLNEFRQLSLQQQIEVIQAAKQILTEQFQLVEPRVNGVRYISHLLKRPTYSSKITWRTQN